MPANIMRLGIASCMNFFSVVTMAVEFISNITAIASVLLIK